MVLVFGSPLHLKEKTHLGEGFNKMFAHINRNWDQLKKKKIMLSLLILVYCK
jgi:hypothetical protein